MNSAQKAGEEKEKSFPNQSPQLQQVPTSILPKLIYSFESTFVGGLYVSVHQDSVSVHPLLRRSHHRVHCRRCGSYQEEQQLHHQDRWSYL